MRPRLVFLTLLLALVPFHRAAAQGGFVNVTATVLDPNGVPYASCHGTIDFVTPANATAQPTLYRGLFPKNFSISQCDSFAKFSITLAATDQIDCGLGSLGCGQWHFSITSQDGKTGFSALLSIGPGNPSQVTNEDISTLLQAAAAPLPISSLSQFLSLSNNWTGLNSFSKQITSTLATGTAPFSIASTTVVPNLNAQLHGGLAAPASAILGLTDTQSPTNKTIDISLNTLKTATNTAGHYPRNNGTQYIDATIQGADIPATTSNCSGVQFAQGLNAGHTPVCVTPPTFGASGASHAVGYVPDPGSTAGTTRFLREDATWAAGGGVSEVTIAGTQQALTLSVATQILSGTFFLPGSHTLTRLGVWIAIAGVGCTTAGTVDLFDRTSGTIVSTFTRFQNFK